MRSMVKGEGWAPSVQSVRPTNRDDPLWREKKPPPTIRLRRLQSAPSTALGGPRPPLRREGTGAGALLQQVGPPRARQRLGLLAPPLRDLAVIA